MLEIPPAIATAANVLRGGGLVAFPTETVYGLGADATSPAAVARIFAVKGRPRFNPLIAHVASLEHAHVEGVFTRDAVRLAERFWPGPLTLVLPRAPTGRVCDLACAGLATIGLRVPDHPLARSLLASVDFPIAAPSANASGRLSPTSAGDVREALGATIDLVIDGDRCAIGVESTILGCLEDRIVLLRPGGLSTDLIEAVVDRKLEPASGGVQAPGMLASHYAPEALLRLDAVQLGAQEVGLDFGRQFGDGAVFDLSRAGDLREAAANLYAALRRLDRAGAATIAVAPIPDIGLGAAINDRLRRAAAPRAPRSSATRSSATLS